MELQKPVEAEDVIERRGRGSLSPLEALLLAAEEREAPQGHVEPTRVARVALRARALEALHARGGGAGAALQVLDVAQGSMLARVDLDKVVQELSRDWAAVTATEVANASRLSLDALGGELGGIEEGLARWVEQELPAASACEALALFARCEGAQEWWREAVMRGVAQASEVRSSSWAQAVWRWWRQEPHHAREILRLVERSAANERWLLEHVPGEVAAQDLSPLIEECRERRWSQLAARLLCAYRELSPRIEALRRFGRSCSSRAVEVVLEGFDPREVIAEAQHSAWQPLLWAAARLTRRNPALFSAVTNPKGAAWLAAAHERGEGAESVEEYLPKEVRARRDYRDGYEDAEQALRLRVLLLGASPKGAPLVDYGAEARWIEQRVRAAKLRDLVKVVLGSAVRAGDLQALLQEHEPHIVHFAGHAGEQGLLLESDGGGKAPVSGQAFAELVRLCSDHVQVVVLNGCSTSEQARELSRYVDFAIGMNDEITQTPAREFAAAFYGALASGKPLRESFKLGKNQLYLLGLVNAVDVPSLYPEKGGEAAFVL